VAMRCLWLAEYFRSGATEGEAAGWRSDVARLVSLEWRQGRTRQEVAEAVARMFHRQDLEEIGSMLDLGFITWEAYLPEAELIVNWLLQDGSRRSGLGGSIGRSA